MQSNKEALLKKSVLLVSFANLSYFFVEFVIARHIEATSLFADSVDFLEDASINLLIFLALHWTSTNKARLGKVLAIIVTIPAFAFLYTAWKKFYVPSVPDPSILSITGFGALVVNVSCVCILMQFRNYQGGLPRAAYLSARNDALANIAIIFAGLVSFIWYSLWPDLLVGFFIMAINLDAAREIWQASESSDLEFKP